MEDPAEDFPSPGTSVGWAVFPDDGQDFETLLHSRSAMWSPRPGSAPIGSAGLGAPLRLPLAAP
jgi:hypothetical protein